MPGEVRLVHLDNRRGGARDLARTSASASVSARRSLKWSSTSVFASI